MPVEEKGNCKIDALVTAGDDYGKFKVKINGVEVLITRTVTEVSDGKYSVLKKESPFFDAGNALCRNGDNGVADSIAGDHVVQRISFGIIELNEGTVSISFIAESVEDANSLIGVDQFMITREKK